MATVNWINVRNDFDAAIEANGMDCNFELRTGETFTLRGVLRAQPEDQMTDGVNQDRRRLSIMAHRWDAAAPAGRDPQKGDVVTVDGRGHAIMEADPALADNIRIGWRLKLKG